MPRIDARLEEIQKRRTQIATEVEQEGADLDALLAEVRSLNEEEAGLQSTQGRIEEVRTALNAGAQTHCAPQAGRESEAEQRARIAASPEYRSAFFKSLLDQPLTREERTAFVHMTDNTSAVLPTTTLNNIWDLISTQHCIMGDVSIYRTGTILEVLKHTSITAGDAKNVAENTVNEDEQNEFAKVTLSGKDFSKSVDISYAMRSMSVDSLESYLTQEIAQRMGAAMAADLVAKIKEDMEAGNSLETATEGEIVFPELAKAFAKLERADRVVVYAKRATVYNYLVSMVDSVGRPIFQPSVQAGAEGSVLGAQIKIEDAVADGELLIGDPSKVVYNMVQDILLESDRDIKKHVITHSGYARGEGALIADKAFAVLKVKSGG